MISALDGTIDSPNRDKKVWLFNLKRLNLIQRSKYSVHIARGDCQFIVKTKGMPNTSFATITNANSAVN